MAVYGTVPEDLPDWLNTADVRESHSSISPGPPSVRDIVDDVQLGGWARISRARLRPPV